MTDESDQAAPDQTGNDRDSAVARAMALKQRRNVATKSSTPARILAAGVAASAAFAMVGAMAVASRQAPIVAASSVEVVERVVVIEVPAASLSPVSIDSAAATPGGQQVTVVREVRVLPAPAGDPTAAPASTEGS